MKPTYEELERQLEESRREFRAADATIHNLELKLTDMAVQLANAESKCRELAAENAGLNAFIEEECFVYSSDTPEPIDANDCKPETPATDAFLAEVRASGVDASIEHLSKKFEGAGHIGVPVMALEWLAQEIRKGAAL